ncbi:MAG: lipase family protein [Actinomycetota bacterium]
MRGSRRTGRGPSSRWAAVTLAVGLVLAACSHDDDVTPSTGPDLDGTTTDEAAPGGEDGFPAGVAVLEAEEDLYALAGDLDPGEPGQPIAVQPVESGLDGTLWRVLHHSRSLEGEDIAVSGLIAVPPGEPPAGGRPLVSWAHGTTGIADECAPSRTPEQLLAAIPLLERGMVVVATDYEGLGTPGRHPYLVGESQGRGVLDVVRAARALGPAVGAGTEVVLWGHSQGGHAVLFANEIATEWAPELDVVGTVAGAPPSQLPLMTGAIGDGPTSFFLAMVVAGWAAAYPELDPAEVLTPAGLERLEAVDSGCVGQVAQAWGAAAEGPLVVEGPVPPAWAERFVDNDPGHRAGAAPVLVLHGGEDQIVPAVTSALLIDQMCEVGQPVQRRLYEEADHTSVVQASLSTMLDWIDARLAGQPAQDDCRER